MKRGGDAEETDLAAWSSRGSGKQIFFSVSPKCKQAINPYNVVAFLKKKKSLDSQNM